MIIAHSRSYICDFCPKQINETEDGLIIFGSVCVMGVRGIKAKINQVPTEENYNMLGSVKTCICWNCFQKKFSPPT